MNRAPLSQSRQTLDFSTLCVSRGLKYVDRCARTSPRSQNERQNQAVCSRFVQYSMEFITAMEAFFSKLLLSLAFEDH
jgi:hypothetical protein